MTTYELTYIVSPEMTSEEAEGKSKEIESAIQKNEGIILRQANPVAKTLSQQIKGHASGFFGVLEFQMEPENLNTIQDLARKDAKIVRHIVLVKKPVRIRKERRARKESPSIFQTAEIKTPFIDNEKKTKILEPEPAKTHEGKGKVELKDIEQQLDEILGE